MQNLHQDASDPWAYLADQTRAGFNIGGKLVTWDQFDEMLGVAPPPSYTPVN